MTSSPSKPECKLADRLEKYAQDTSNSYIGGTQHTWDCAEAAKLLRIHAQEAWPSNETMAEIIECGTIDALETAHYAIVYRHTAAGKREEITNIPEVFCREIARHLHASPPSRQRSPAESLIQRWRRRADELQAEALAMETDEETLAYEVDAERLNFCADELFKALFRSQEEGTKTFAIGCCSASFPCEHQKRDPTTICDTCATASTRDTTP